MSTPDPMPAPVSYRQAIRRRVSWRDFWTLAVTVLVLLALANAKGASDKANKGVAAIQEGRKAGTELTCAISTAVVVAGRNLVESSGKAPMPPKLEAFLVSLGYPDPQQREAQSREAGRRYVQHVSEAIEQAAGVQGLKVGSEILNPDGTVDCARLREVARVR